PCAGAVVAPDPGGWAGPGRAGCAPGGTVGWPLRGTDRRGPRCAARGLRGRTGRISLERADRPLLRRADWLLSRGAGWPLPRGADWSRLRGADWPRGRGADRFPDRWRLGPHRRAAVRRGEARRATRSWSAARHREPSPGAVARDGLDPRGERRRPR